MNSTGTATGTVAVSGTGNTRTVTINSITGDGSLSISLAAGTASDTAGNLSAAAGPSATVIVDNTPVFVGLSSPSATITKAGPVTFTVTYVDANFNQSTLAAGNITLNKTGTANGTVAVSGTGNTRTVTISSITGDGALGISVAAGTAADLAGNSAPAAGPSAMFTVDNTAPTVAISAPSVSATKNGPVTYTVTYSDPNFNTSTLATGNITLNTTGTAAGTIGLSGSSTSYTVTISSITGNGTLGISIAANTASDTAGNNAAAAGPSTTFIVDTTPPSVAISAPSITSTRNGPVTYTVTYSDANFNQSTLINNNVTLNLTGTANGAAIVSGTGNTRTVTLVGLSGDGTIGISLAAGTASDTAGNLALAAGPSTTFIVDNTPPTVAISAPSLSTTAAGPVTYTITYSDTNFNASTLAVGNITLNATGTATGTVAVSGAGNTRTVTIASITGDGTLGISVAANTASDSAGNNAPAAGPSSTFIVDNTATTVSISAPSSTATKGGPITYTVTYTDPNFSSSTLAAGNITLNKTGTANGTVAVSGSGNTRTVTISSITGDGTLGISLAAGTATDTAGNSAPAAGPSATFIVDNTAPTVAIGAPSAAITRTTAVTYTITYTDANFNASTLSTGDVTLNKTGTANGAIGISGAGTTRTVTISSITGDGTLGISLAAGTAGDIAGNLAAAAGPSTTFIVDNTLPSVAISSPSAAVTKGGPVTYTVTYSDTNFNASTLAAGNVTLNTTGTATGTVAVTGSGTTRTVTISSITGDGTLGISLAAGTASDNAGNLAAAAGPSTPFIVDNTPPAISISAPSLASTNAGPVTYTVTYTDTNFNSSTLAAGNITLNKTGTANGTVVISGSGSTRTVTISSITGDGTIGISVAAATATDTAGNSAGAAGPSSTFVVDNTAPVVAISAPSATATRNGPITYTVTYTDTNFNASTLSAGDITLNKTGTANGAAFVSGTGNTRTVTLVGLSGDGTLGISLAAGTASDTAGNLSAAAGPSTTFIVDNTAPTVAISAPSAASTKAGPVTYTVNYTDANFSASTLGTGDITLNKTGTATGTAAISGSGNTRTVTISGITGDGSIGISVGANTASDTAGNSAPAAGPSGTFIVDNTAPTISISAPSVASTTSGSVTYTVTYADTNFNSSTLAAGNITLNKTGTATGTAAVSGSGNTRTVTISSITGDGTIGISIAGTARPTPPGTARPPPGQVPPLSWTTPRLRWRSTHLPPPLPSLSR